MDGVLVVAPILVPLAAALATALCAARPALQQALSLAGALLLVGACAALFGRVEAAGPIRVALGGWSAPFGIEFAADALSAGLCLVAAAMGLAALLFQLCGVDAAEPAAGLHPLVHALLAGVGGAFATADLFNLYVWFEVMLIAALGLLVLRPGPRNLEAALNYFMLNAAGTLLMLIAAAGLYGTTGHLNFAAIESALRSMDPARPIPWVALLMLALLVKAGAFPLFAWLPASYHTLPAPLLALFAALPTKVGVYAVIRMTGGVFPALPQGFLQALGWIAAATMLAGVLGAAYHWDLRRILAFHIVSQIGYMLLGVALGTEAGRTGAIFYIFHHILVKSNLFLIAGLVCRLAGGYDLRRIGGLAAARPWLGWLFLVPALSLVGIPPLSGFFAKLLLLRECFAGGHAAWGIIALLVGLLTLYSMSKVWIEAFWKPHPDAGWAPPAGARIGAASAIAALLALATTAIGAAPDTFLRFASRAAAGLAGGGP